MENVDDFLLRHAIHLADEIVTPFGCDVERVDSIDVADDQIAGGAGCRGRSARRQRGEVKNHVADNGAWIFTDFKIDNGFSRFLVLNESMTQRQTGRTVQRLVEIETYRLMALVKF